MPHKLTPDLTRLYENYTRVTKKTCVTVKCTEETGRKLENFKYQGRVIILKINKLIN